MSSMCIDTSFIYNPMTAVACKTENEWKLLIQQLSALYPEHAGNLSNIMRSWYIYHNKNGLALRFYYNNCSGRPHYGFAKNYFYRKNGFTVYNFGDIYKCIDLGEIQSEYADTKSAVLALF